MLPHQQRVVSEKVELDEKISKLREFISSTNFAALVQDADERHRLARQWDIMGEYSLVLAERIANFK